MNNGAKWETRAAPSVPLVLDLPRADHSLLHLECELVFDWNALHAIELETGVSALTANIFADQTVTNASVLFWAALQARHPELGGPEGLAVVRSYVDLGTLPQIWRALEAAFLASLSDEAQKRLRTIAQNPPPPAAIETDARRPPGPTSGPLPDTTSDSPAMSSAA